MMKFTYNILKVILAGVIAVIILSVVLMPYTFMPVHINNHIKNTDYVWPSESYWMKMTEGISFGKFDANGYNNLNVVDNPDIIIVGSSHMEATNVMQDENVGYLLNQKLENRYSVYNMGISGHHLYKVCQYLPQTLEIYDNPPKAIIIETSTVELTTESVNQVIEKSVKFTPSYNYGLIATMQKIPFFRIAYQQIEGGLLDLFMPEKLQGKNDDDDLSNDYDDVDLQAYTYLFTYLKSIEDKYGTEIIIFYHPFEKLKDDGTVEFEKTQHLEAFESAAQNYNLNFIDMTERFEKMYYEDNHVPHGFATGKIASGHLNAYGHAAISDVLLEEIGILEKEGRI